MTLHVPGPVARALRAFAAELRARLGDRLVDVRLFGSHARGDAHPDSDVDVVVVHDFDRDFAPVVLDAIGAAMDRAWSEGRVLPSVLPVTRPNLEHLRRRERRLALDIDREGIPL